MTEHLPIFLGQCRNYHLMRPCVELEEKHNSYNCWSDLNRTPLNQNFFLIQDREEHCADFPGDFQSSCFKNITVYLGKSVLRGFWIGFFRKHHYLPGWSRRKLEQKGMAADFWGKKQSKVKPFSHLAFAKLPLLYFCLTFESKASYQ